MAKCIAELKVCQGASERISYAFNITREFARQWQPDFPYAVDVALRPPGDETVGTGFDYVSSGGQSAGVAPEWPLVEDEEVVDGSITWTAADISNASLEHRIASVVWSAPAALTLDEQVEVDSPGLQEALIHVSGGAAGQTYTITGLIETVDGDFYEVRIILSII